MKNILTLSIHSRISGFLLLFLMISLSPSVHAQLFDTQFNNGDWSMLILPAPTWSSPLAQCGHPAPNPACQCGQVNIGNPSPPSRQTCTYYPYPQPGDPPPPPPQPWSIWIVHLYTPPSSFYDPSTQGAIAGVRFSYDLSPPSRSMTYGLLLFQNGKYFRSGPADTPANSAANAPTWKIFPSRTLTAADFTEVKNGGDSGIRPDFSCKGSPIQFGYVTGTSSGNHWSQSLIDNWKVDIIKGECLCLKRLKETIACGQVGYSYSVQLQNQIGTTIPQIQVVPTLPTGVTVSQQMFTVALAPNGITTLHFTITGASPGATVSLRFLPIGVGTSQCCPPEIKVTMPKPGQC
jgi:hypothetical protein